MKPQPLYRTLAQLIQARINCRDSENADWFATYNAHTDRLLALAKEHMPSGSGIDSGTTIDLELSTPECLVFHTSYHHMSDGTYDGWTEHTVKVRASLVTALDIRIGGRDRNCVKDYLYEVFNLTLVAEVK